MKKSWSGLAVVALVVGTSGVGAAAPPSAPAPKASTPASTSASSAVAPSASDAAGPRRDPAGVRGISPLNEAILRGDRLYLARDFEGALREYQGGVTLAPTQPLGHLRLAEVFLMQGKFSEAEGALATASRFANGEFAITARVSFLLALAREGQAPPEKAIEAWQSYEKLAQEKTPGSTPEAGPGAPVVKLYATTATTRKQAFLDHAKLVQDYAAVRERIEKTVEKADASIKKESAK